MKEKKGVTLIALVITIIIIMILASIAIYSGASTIRYAKYNKAKSEIQVIQSYVNEWYKEYQKAEDKNTFLGDYGELIGTAIDNGKCTQAEIDSTFAGGGITDDNKKSNYRFFSESFIKEKIGLDASFDYLISIKDRNTILYNGIIYNKEPYYTLDDFGLQNIKEISPDSIDFKLEQGENTDIIISDIAIKYKEIKIIEQENKETTIVEVERFNDIGKFIVEYRKNDETSWTDVTKDVIKFEDEGEIKFKFSVSEGSYNVRIWTTDKKKQGGDSIIVIKSNLTPNEKIAIATHNQNNPTEEPIKELSPDEINNDNLKDKNIIRAVLTGAVPIPNDGDAEYIEGSVDTGVVIRYKGSEFVWVPVPNAIYDSSKDSQLPKSSATGSLTEGHNYTPMAIQVDENYKGLLYSYNAANGAYLKYASASPYQGTTSQYREPAYLSGSSYDDNTTYGGLFTENDLQTSYNTMIASVAKYGGFFIGRYETSYDGTDVASVSGVNPMSAESSSGNMWYGMYQKQKNFTTSTDKMQVEMIWGSQYDAMLNWAMKGTDKAKVTSSTNGNHSGSVVTCGNSTYSTDKINNIYDLGGNLYEWTQEASSTTYRASRGGRYSFSTTPSSRNDGVPGGAYAVNGSRLSLYIR